MSYQCSSYPPLKILHLPLLSPNDFSHPFPFGFPSARPKVHGGKKDGIALEWVLVKQGDGPEHHDDDVDDDEDDDQGEREKREGKMVTVMTISIKIKE